MNGYQSPSFSRDRNYHWRGKSFFGKNCILIKWLKSLEENASDIIFIELTLSNKNGISFL